MMLDIANAGIDDGIPPSILREVTLATNLESKYLCRIIESGVRGKCVQIIYEKSDYNLREYIKAH